jgi:hypothetical protein
MYSPSGHMRILWKKFPNLKIPTNNETSLKPALIKRFATYSTESGF